MSNKDTKIRHINMKRLVKCNKCQNEFVQKYVNHKGGWSKLNEVSFWTDNKEQGYCCRPCLKKWWEYERENFNSLVNENKKKLFLDYKYRGTLDQNDHISA